jgi:hypothetical protein
LTQVGRDQVVGAKSADQCGKCVETTADGVPFEVNLTTGRCEDPTVFEPELTAEEQECKDSGRIYDETTGTCTDKCINKDYEVDPVSGDCGPPAVEECTDPNRLKNPDGSCSDKCKSGEIDPQTGRCPEPEEEEEVVDEGTDTSGVYEGVDQTMDEFCRQGLAALEGTFAAKSWRFNCSDDYCLSGAPKKEVDGVYGANCEEYTPPYTPVVECTDPKRYKNPDGSCSDRCTDGTPAPTDGSLCGQVSSIDRMCSQPRPEEYGYAQINWDKYCADDQPVVDDGVDDGEEENYGFVVDCEQPKIVYTPSFNYDKNLAYNNYSREYDNMCFAGTDGGSDDPDCSTITEANYRACGKVKCPDGSFKDNYDACFAATDTEEEDDVAVVDTEEEDDDVAVVDTEPDDDDEPAFTPCDQQNRVTNPDGSCGECKPGWIEDPEGFDQCIQAPPECNDCSCPGYAVANPKECAQCPEGQEYCEATGACATPEECAAASAPPPEPDSGGMLGGGGAGAFTPFLAGLDYEAQPLPAVEAPPQKDYMAELDNLIKRNLFEGLV